MTDHTDIVERLNAITPDQGWAVVNKKTEGVVIWFSKWKTFNAHKEALAFLGASSLRRNTRGARVHEPVP